MPFAFDGLRPAVRQVVHDVDVPVADELPEQIELVSHLRLGPGAEQRISQTADSRGSLAVLRVRYLVDKSALMRAVWPNAVVEENNLNQCILTLRRALGEHAPTSETFAAALRRLEACETIEKQEGM